MPTEDELTDYYKDSYYAYSKPKTDFDTKFFRMKNIGTYLHKSFLKRYRGYKHLNIISSKILAFFGKLLIYPAFNWTEKESKYTYY